MSKIVSFIFILALALGNVVKADQNQYQFSVVITQKASFQKDVPRFVFQTCNLREKGCSALGSLEGYTEAQINEIIGIWVQRSPLTQYALVALMVPTVAVVDGVVTVYGGILFGSGYILTSAFGHALQLLSCTGKFVADKAFHFERDASSEQLCDVKESAKLHVAAFREIGGYYMKPINGTSELAGDLLVSAHHAKFSTPLLQEVIAKKQSKLVITVDGESLRSLEDVLR